MNEEILDLQYKDLKLIQDKDGYCFTSDSVLLANYVKTHAKDIVVEFCAGSGVISILLSKKQNCQRIYGIELQPRLADMFARSIKLNNLENVEAVNMKLEQAKEKFGNGKIDVVMVNPPYMEGGDRSENPEIAIATHEIETTLESIIESASQILKYGGKFYMVHRVDRLVDCLSLLRKYKLEPKHLQIIYPKMEAEPVVFLIKAIKNGKKGLRLAKVTFAEDVKYSCNEIL